MIRSERGERQYAYHSQWRDGKAVKTYLGTGEVAEAATAEIGAQRLQKWQQREAQREADRRLREALRLAKCFSGKVDLLAAAVLTVAGHHRPHYRAWRRRRVRRDRG